MLSFAIIMLNTDAHNPLAERRLFRTDFVQMNSQPSAPSTTTTTTATAVIVSTANISSNPDDTPLSSDATGNGGGGGGGGGVLSYEPVLPVEELEAIYERIVAHEIRIKDDDVALLQQHQQQQQQQQQQQAGANDNHGPDLRTTASSLASALGIRAFNTPFKQKVARGWRQDQKGLSDAEKKRRLVELAERAVLSSASPYEGHGSGQWRSSSHADLARCERFTLYCHTFSA